MFYFLEEAFNKHYQIAKTFSDLKFRPHGFNKTQSATDFSAEKLQKKALMTHNAAANAHMVARNTE